MTRGRSLIKKKSGSGFGGQQRDSGSVAYFHHLLSSALSYLLEVPVLDFKTLLLQLAAYRHYLSAIINYYSYFIMKYKVLQNDHAA